MTLKPASKTALGLTCAFSLQFMLSLAIPRFIAWGWLPGLPLWAILALVGAVVLRVATTSIY